MHNFHFHHYTDMLFGKDTELQTGEMVKKHGGKKVLLVYGGGSIKRSGLYDRVIQSLNDAGVAIVEHGGIKPNPILSCVYEGLEKARKENVDFVLAVGGGSSMDTAKAIALGMVYDGDVWDFYSGKVPEKMAPVGVVVTISGTGSETSRSSVITKEEGCLKRGFMYEVARPTFCILNPELTYTLPPFQTAAGATDAFAHTFERFFCEAGSNDLTDHLAAALMRSVVKNSKIVMKEPENYDARAEIMLAAALSHDDFTGLGRGVYDSASHSLEHELSASYDVAHGAGLAVVMPAWVQYIYKRNPEQYVKFCNLVFDVPLEGSADEIVAEGVKRFRAWLKEIGMPVTMKELGIPDNSQFAEMAHRCRRNPRGLIGNVYDMTPEDIINIFESVLA